MFFLVLFQSWARIFQQAITQMFLSLDKVLHSWFYLLLLFFYEPTLQEMIVSVTYSQVNQLFSVYMIDLLGSYYIFSSFVKWYFHFLVARIILQYNGSMLFGHGHCGVTVYIFKLSNWWLKVNFHLPLYFCKGAFEWGFWQWWYCGPLPSSWKTSVLYGF